MFGQSINNFRNKYRLTQQQFIDKLVMNDSDFYKLDSVTLSRWENNKTEPSLRKKMSVMDFMGQTYKFINQSVERIENNKVVDNFIQHKFENSSIIITDILENGSKYIDIITDMSLIKKSVFLNEYLKDSQLVLDENCNLIAVRRNKQIKSILLYNEDKISNCFIFTLLTETKKGFEYLFVKLLDLIINTKCLNVQIYTFDKHDYRLWKSTSHIKSVHKKVVNDIVRDELSTTRIDLLSNRYLIDLYIKITQDTQKSKINYSTL
ncbi:helix-turn-helix domain-containing protein [Photobacterium damselae]|uniref:helix-turn-helix domain-containing protein n=1 Tax=Photobacterium damselae TaxID=38293 RepID=UPI001EFDAFFF|nr:helix-turn-helix transcriptional regulator [Photobacterium damselae]MCG9778841.1 helix-turn-helix domain-containing protein [Photobacterium damselae]